MRAVLPVVLAVALILSLSPPGSAAVPTAYDDAPLRAVQFVDANEGWAVGDDGVVWHSTDGGKSWDRQKTGTRASLRAVQFLTPYTGWVAGRVERPTGSAGVLLRTTDGGFTWTEAGAVGLPGLNAVQFFDEKTGVVAGDGTSADPSGVFLTRDGGASWAPVAGPRCPSVLAVDFASPDAGFLGGMWGRFAALKNGAVAPVPANVPGGRAVRAVKVVGGQGVMAGDGGMLCTAAAAAAGPWVSAELPLPPAARAVCDFRCVAARGDKVWVAGRPGSVVLYSPDAGKTWEVRKTGVAVPLNGLCMVSDRQGWAVGEFGTVLGTTDGGQTWAVLRGGGRAAVLFANGSAGGVPLAALPGLGAADGYLSAAVAVTTPDPATADPARAADGFRMAAAVRAAGGAAADPVWGFPLPAHCDGLTAEQLLGYWDAYAGGSARDQLLRQMVLAVRVWRPDVVVAGTLSPDAGAADQASLLAAREAFRLAADPSAFPEQVDVLGLAPHAPKKLYARVPAPAAAQVALDTAAFRQDLADSWDGAAGASLFPDVAAPAGPLGFRLVSHRLDGADRHASLTQGCDLARGGMARRAAELPRLNPEYVAAREGVVLARRRVAELVAPAAFERDGEVVFSRAAEAVAGLPEDGAAEALVAAADGCARAGRWTAARELYLLAVNRFPTQPAAAGAARWLVRYHASGEALRRIELAQHPITRAVTFTNASPRPAEGVVQVGFTESAGPRVRFRSSEAERGWVGTGVDLEPRLFAVDPAALRDPATQLALSAGRLRLGLTSDAERALGAYRRGVDRSRAAPGENPWLDAVAAELWVANRGAAAAPPKPLGACRKTSARPHLDGKLDDECWQAATRLPVAAGPGDLAAAHPTEARFLFDGEFLYVGVTCGHPAAEPAVKATRRRRDEDLRAHDRVEILLDLDRDYQTYYRLRIDRRGCVAEDCSGDTSWDPRWFVAVEPTATGWTAEAAIPVAELTGSPPRHANIWAANVVRVLPGRGVLAWSGPADAAPRPEGMGLIEFLTK